MIPTEALLTPGILKFTSRMLCYRPYAGRRGMKKKSADSKNSLRGEAEMGLGESWFQPGERFEIALRRGHTDGRPR